MISSKHIESCGILDSSSGWGIGESSSNSSHCIRLGTNTMRMMWVHLFSQISINNRSGQSRRGTKSEFKTKVERVGHCQTIFSRTHYCGCITCEALNELRISWSWDRRQIFFHRLTVNIDPLSTSKGNIINSGTWIFSMRSNFVWTFK